MFQPLEDVDKYWFDNLQALDPSEDHHIHEAKAGEILIEKKHQSPNEEYFYPVDGIPPEIEEDENVSYAWE